MIVGFISGRFSQCLPQQTLIEMSITKIPGNDDCSHTAAKKRDNGDNNGRETLEMSDE